MLKKLLVLSLAAVSALSVNSALLFTKKAPVVQEDKVQAAEPKMAHASAGTALTSYGFTFSLSKCHDLNGTKLTEGDYAHYAVPTANAVSTTHLMIIRFHGYKSLYFWMDLVDTSNYSTTYYADIALLYYNGTTALTGNAWAPSTPCTLPSGTTDVFAICDIGTYTLPTIAMNSSETNGGTEDGIFVEKYDDLDYTKVVDTANPTCKGVNATFSNFTSSRFVEVSKSPIPQTAGAGIHTADLKANCPIAEQHWIMLRFHGYSKINPYIELKMDPNKERTSDNVTKADACYKVVQTSYDGGYNYTAGTARDVPTTGINGDIYMLARIDDYVDPILVMPDADTVVKATDGSQGVYAIKYSTYTYIVTNSTVAGKTITVDVDSKLSQDDLFTKAVGDLSEWLGSSSGTMSITSSDYKVGSVGTFTISFKYSLMNGNSISSTLTVNAVDKTKPVIVQKSAIAVAYGSAISESEILSHFAVNDNIDGSPTVKVTYPDNFKVNTNLLYGVYTLKITATDSAGNESFLNFNIDVYDKTAPVISRNDKASLDNNMIIGYSKNNPVTVKRLLAMFKAADEISGDCELSIKEGKVESTVGQHSVVISAVDKDKNEITYTAHYRVVAELPDVCIADSQIVDVGCLTELKEADISSIISKGLHAGATNIEVNTADLEAYSAKAYEVGSSFEIKYSYTGSDGVIATDSMSLFIIDQEEGTTASAKVKNAWANFCQWWADLGQRIKNFFTGKGWKTDAEVNTAAPATDDKSSSSSAPADTSSTAKSSAASK
jgi:hypothetical protein